MKFVISKTRQEAVDRARETVVSLMAGERITANSIAVLYDDLSWYPYLWGPPEVLDSGHTAISYRGKPIPPVEVNTSVWTEPDDDSYLGGYNYFFRRRSALEITLPEERKGAVRCLHLESAIGLEFEAVILLLDLSTLTQLTPEGVAKIYGFGEHLVLIDDDGFDAGVWLKSLSSPDAMTARAYVGCTRARTVLTVIGSEGALSMLHPAINQS